MRILFLVQLPKVPKSFHSRLWERWEVRWGDWVAEHAELSSSYVSDAPPAFFCCLLHCAACMRTFACMCVCRHLCGLIWQDRVCFVALHLCVHVRSTCAHVFWHRWLVSCSTSKPACPSRVQQHIPQRCLHAIIIRFSCLSAYLGCCLRRWQGRECWELGTSRFCQLLLAAAAMSKTGYNHAS